MFLVQFINTVRNIRQLKHIQGLIIMLVNARISEIKMPSFIPLFRGDYSDFTV